jgi:zinc protease
MTLRYAGAVVALGLFAVLAGCGRGPSVHETRLDNGLKVVVEEDHRAPVVVSQVWYKVGSSYEPAGLTGISHMLEHMMFKGTRAHKAGEFSRIIAENGGRENAFTGLDYTAYFQQLEKSRLAVSFELEADRMRNLVLDDKEFQKERKVVREERRMRTDDQPESLVYERFMATAFKHSPYHHPVIGWAKDIENYKVEDLKNWYQRWYAPDNATLVVVGDVDPQAVFKLAQKYFGPVRPSEIKPPKSPVEPKQTETRVVHVKAPAQVPYIILGFHVPVETSKDIDPWEPYALDVLANILDGGSSARLPKDLVRGKQIAAAVSSGYNRLARLPTLFMVDANPAEGHTVDELKTAILEEIDRLKQTPVSPTELERVKAQAVASDVYQRDSMFYQAMKIGMLETVGLSWRRVDDYVDRIREVTPAQVQAVAKKYLNPSNMTVGILDPQPISGPRKPMQPGGPHNDVR